VNLYTPEQSNASLGKLILERIPLVPLVLVISALIDSTMKSTRAGVPVKAYTG
jgi:hypothetical protein